MKDDFPYHMLDDFQYVEKRMEEDELRVKDYKQTEMNLNGMEE